MSLTSPALQTTSCVNMLAMRIAAFKMWVTLFLLISSGPAPAQIQIGTVRGTVADSEQARMLSPFEGASIRPKKVLAYEAGFSQDIDGLLFDTENLLGRRFIYNFGNPLSGTHFGHLRLLSGGSSWRFANRNAGLARRAL